MTFQTDIGIGYSVNVQHIIPENPLNPILTIILIFMILFLTIMISLEIRKFRKKEKIYNQKNLNNIKVKIHE